LSHSGNRAARTVPGVPRENPEPKIFTDFVCYDKIIVELKAVTELADEHRAQVLNYLKAGGFELGLLVNFGHYPKLQYERIVKTQVRPDSREAIYL
jgi:hypothetical protein